MVIKNTYIRRCFMCNSEIEYKSYNGFYNANRNNSKCKKCANKIAGERRSATWKKRAKSKKYLRNCPECNEIIIYKNRQSVWLGNKHNAKCKKCANIDISKTLKRKHSTGELIITLPGKDVEQRKKYYNLCPSCTSKKYYTTKSSRDYAKKKGTVCNSCSTIKYKKGIAYNLTKSAVKKMRASKAGYSSWEEYVKKYPEKEMYKREVWRLTYKQPIANLSNWELRGRCGINGAYQLDHIIPIDVGYNRNISPNVLANIDNLRMIPWEVNRKRSSHIGIDIEFNEFIDTLNLPSNYVIKYLPLIDVSELRGIYLEKYTIKNELNKLESFNNRYIVIFSDEWMNSKDIVKSRLLYLSTGMTTRIFARKCKITEISSAIKNNFLIQNHIQGRDQSIIKLGLECNNQLVSVMTFRRLNISKNKQNSDKNVYELSRFANLINYSVVGGASKLFKYFVKTYNPNKIISYADRRWSSNINETVYTKIGMQFKGFTRPNYWYTLDYINRQYRYKFAKHKIINELGGNKQLTEWENMKEFGYDRIWDAGHLRYEWTTTESTNSLCP